MRKLFSLFLVFAVCLTIGIVSEQSALASYGNSRVNPDPSSILFIYERGGITFIEPAKWGDNPITVYASPEAPVTNKKTDQNNIQWAVDAVTTGGTVFLNSRAGRTTNTPFAFYVYTPFDPNNIMNTLGSDPNNSNYIEINQDVSIVGEDLGTTPVSFKAVRGVTNPSLKYSKEGNAGGINARKTVIYGGGRGKDSSNSGNPLMRGVFNILGNYNVNISNIHFEQPGLAAIAAYGSGVNGVNIHNCDIFYPNELKYQDAETTTTTPYQGHGILVSNQYPYGNFNGPVNIFNNFINFQGNSYSDPSKPVLKDPFITISGNKGTRVGISVCHIAASIPVTIQGNTIKYCPRAGIFISEAKNINLQILNNEIYQRKYAKSTLVGIDTIEPGNGIMAVTTAATFCASSLIQGNYISGIAGRPFDVPDTDSAQSAYGWAINANSLTSSTIKDNTINLDGGFGININQSGNTIQNNQFISTTGSGGAFAIWLDGNNCQNNIVKLGDGRAGTGVGKMRELPLNPKYRAYGAYESFGTPEAHICITNTVKNNTINFNGEPEGTWPQGIVYRDDNGATTTNIKNP